jgi:hypothetical protein
LTLELSLLKPVADKRPRFATINHAGRRVHCKIERLGLVDLVIELFEKGTFYEDISREIKSRTGHQVSRSAVHRFVKRYRAKNAFIHEGKEFNGKKKGAYQSGYSDQDEVVRKKHESKRVL